MAFPRRRYGEPVIEVEAHVVDGPHSGGWCDACALPSEIEFTAVVTAVIDPTLQLGRFLCVGCTECGATRSTQIDTNR